MKRQLLSLVLMLATALAGIAAGNLNGYYRVKTAAGGYMNVTGSFTAKADCAEGDLLANPGTLFYVTSEADASQPGHYVLGNLGAQGIDLAKDEFAPDFDGANGFADLLMGALDSSNPLYGMVHQGYRYGYTSVARATLGTVFGLVAGKLENYGNKLNGQTINGFEYGEFNSGDFNDVTADFNKKVVANLDIHLRTTAAAGSPDAMYIYVDMPDFQDVVDWYNNDKKNGARFYRATLAMNYWLLHGSDSKFDPADFEEGMYFVQSDIDDLKKWGYDYVALCNPEVLVDGGKSYYKYTFDQVFSDKALLFNWIKLMAYRIINPETDVEGIYSSILGKTDGMDIAGLMKEHAITRFIYEQFEAFQPDSRIYFVAGNVVDGTYNAEGQHLGFAIGDAALAAAGDYGKWIPEEVKSGTAAVSVALGTKAGSKNQGAFMFDFPVKATDAATRLCTISEIKTITDLDGNTHSYVELVPVAGGVVPAKTPFIVESTAATAQLAVAAEAVVMNNIRRVYSESTNYAVGLKGVLLASSYDNLKSLWETELTQNIFRLSAAAKTNTDTQQQSAPATAFGKISPATLSANEVVFAGPEADTKAYFKNQVLVGKPVFYAPDADVPVTLNGYYRVKTAAGGYMNVTGPFTANANLSQAQLLSAPGSLFYLTCAPAAKGNVLGNLAAQGIDLAKDEFAPDFDGGNGFNDLMMAIDLDNPLYSMVQQGFRYGYTSVARAALATAFSFVAGRLEGHANGIEGYTKDEFIEVTNSFNKNVVANLDIHLRAKAVPGADDQIYLYVDMPDFQDVVDWYALPENHDSFYRATLAMNKWLMDTTDGMILTPYDLETFDKWGFNYAPYVTKVDVSGNPQQIGSQLYNEITMYTFDTVFSNADFLFNWIKLFAYRLIVDDPEGVYTGQLGNYGDSLGAISELMQQHTITRFIYEQFEAFQPDSRIYFVAGNVVDGTYNAEDRHLGFAVGDEALAAAGDYGKWIVEQVYNGDVVLNMNLTAKADATYHGAGIYDFPVTVATEGASFMAGEMIEYLDDCHPDPNVWETHHYLELTEIEGGVAAAEPFIIESSVAKVALALNYSAGEPTKAPKRRAAASATDGLKGTLLATSADNLQGTWGDDNKSNVYRLSTPAPYTNTLTGVSQTSTNNAFVLDTDGLKANEAAYTTPTDTKLSQDQVLLAKPVYEYNEEDQTGVADVVIENPAENVIYDLQGKRVARPEAGKIYIVNGRKLYFF